MYPISKLLKQQPALTGRAVEQTRDTNKAYLVVHGVMAHALGRVGETEHDLGPGLTSTLAARVERLSRQAAVQ